MAARSERGHVAKLDSARSKTRAKAGVELPAKADCEPQRFIREFRVAAGDLAVEKNDNAGALREYGAAGKLVPTNAEMVFWHAVALVNMGRVDESLPIFRRVFAMDRNWVTLTPRLTK